MDVVVFVVGDISLHIRRYPVVVFIQPIINILNRRRLRLRKLELFGHGRVVGGQAEAPAPIHPRTLRPRIKQIFRQIQI